MKLSEKYFEKILTNNSNKWFTSCSKEIARYGEYCRLEAIVNALASDLHEHNEAVRRLRQMAAEDGLV